MCGLILHFLLELLNLHFARREMVLIGCLKRSASQIGIEQHSEEARDECFGAFQSCDFFKNHGIDCVWLSLDQSSAILSHLLRSEAFHAL